MDQRERQQPVRARADAHPFVGNRPVAAAHRVHGHDLGAAALHVAQAQLDRVGIVVFGHAPEHQVLAVLPVGLAELPEAAAQRVQAAGGHVHRTKTAVRRVVDRAVLLRPPAGQGLALVAAGEKGQAVGVFRAGLAQPAGGQVQGLVPFDFAELVLAAFAHPQQRLVQPRRRIVLHDAGRALGAQHAAVHRVRRVAFDVAHPAFAQVHVDAAAAGAHVAGGLADLVPHRLLQIEDGLVHGAHCAGRGRRVRGPAPAVAGQGPELPS